jgi:FeS assembly SUF system regulator
MLRITKETDYGILLLGRMTSGRLGEIHTARRLAAASGISSAMVAKILRYLARGGILNSTRGAGGGYRLERPAERISVADVIRAIEGPISLVQCGSEPGACEHEQGCPTRLNWNLINRVVEDALEQMPVAEMVASCDCPLLTLPLETTESIESTA